MIFDSKSVMVYKINSKKGTFCFINPSFAKSIERQDLEEKKEQFL